MEKMKVLLYVLCVIAITCVVTLMIFVPDGGYKFSTNKKCIETLNGFGWEVGRRPVKTEAVQIPDTFDVVYTDYNKLQKDSGFDLEKYKGQKAMRYTYIVKNYPDVDAGEIYANVLIIDGTVIGGDIMSSRLDGFMHSLNI